MKSKIMAGVLMFIIISVLLTGCGGKQKEIPYPDGYYVPKPEETETAGKSDKSQKNASETAKETTRETIQARAGSETENKKISFYLDTSGSMQRSPEVVKIHAAATKCAAGYEERHFYSVDSRNLIETTEQLALSGQYGKGAPIDLIRDGTLPCDPESVNVLTTDLQTGTSCSEIGKWLVNTGATGYSFYVFTMQYNGSLQFKMYTSSSVLETVSVKDCSFAQKEFLMIVFGKNSLVEDYDQFFQYKLGTEVPYDTCHVSLHAEKKQEDHFLQLTSSKCFEDDIANVTYDNTNYVFGMSLVDTENTEFTCPNTFVYKKSRYSTSKAKKAVKAILYAVPDQAVPAVEKAEITNVMEYDEESGTYKESNVTFKMATKAYLGAFSAIVNEVTDTKKYQRLYKDLGGVIAQGDSIFTVSLENESLPKGLFAVEAQLTFAETGEVADLQKFAANHSAGLEDYSTALKSECTPEIIKKQESTSKFYYTGDGSSSSVFCKLLEFEKITDELIAAGAVAESDNEMLTIRLIIDNR